MKGVFFKLKGNNGSIYFINAKSFSSILYSFDFYRPLGLRGKFIRIFVLIFVYFISKFRTKKLLNINQVSIFLRESLNTNLDFDLSSKSALYISPTADKLIIKNDNSFTKYAVGKSFNGAKNEILIYSLFNPPPLSFKVSKLHYYKVHDEKLIEFKLFNKFAITKENKRSNIVEILIEMFKFSNNQSILLSEYVENLSDKIYNLDDTIFKKFLNKIKTKYADLQIPLGFVHKDFKLWNIRFYERPLIFDFEESTTSGIPLEDLFNFQIYPKIISNKVNSILKIFFKEKNKKKYNEYLKSLDTKIPYEIFLVLYSIERCSFWKNKDFKLHNKYLSLSKKIIFKIDEKNSI